MVSDRELKIIRARFTGEPDPDQLELLDDESLDAMRDHRVPQPKSRRQPMRKASSDE